MTGVNDVFENLSPKFEENLPKIEILIRAAIKNCQTHSYKAKDIAKDLRNNGFDGYLASDLVKELELALKFAHFFQAYINASHDQE